MLNIQGHRASLPRYCDITYHSQALSSTIHLTNYFKTFSKNFFFEKGLQQGTGTNI
jgi:hypothetical protein